jgi:branched-chain amino acid transport system ATP-binding protein
VDRVLGVVAELRSTGTAVLLVEQLIDKALAVSDRVYAMAQGRVVLQARADEPGLHQRLEHAYFGAAAPA